MLHTITKQHIYEACRHSDGLDCPEWLDELIDLGIAYLQNDLDKEEFDEMCDCITKGMY